MEGKPVRRDADPEPAEAMRLYPVLVNGMRVDGMLVDSGVVAMVLAMQKVIVKTIVLQ